MIFLDTSGLLAVLDASEARHPQATRAWREILDGSETLVTTSYVLVETTALAQRRLGLGAVADLEQAIVPAVNVVWVDEELHRFASGALLAARRRELSLVDCVSFAVMRQRGIRTAFALDRHFAEQGFTLVPGLASPAEEVHEDPGTAPPAP